MLIKKINHFQSLNQVHSLENLRILKILLKYVFMHGKKINVDTTVFQIKKIYQF